jgi:hypothetical protein
MRFDWRGTHIPTGLVGLVGLVGFVGAMTEAGTVGALGTDVVTLADALALAEAGGKTGAGGAGACARLMVMPGTAVAAADAACTCPHGVDLVPCFGNDGMETSKSDQR